MQDGHRRGGAPEGAGGPGTGAGVPVREAAREARRSAIEAGLAHAIARDELSVVLQPLLCLADGRICGFEALLRWHSAELGEVTPTEFVPIAEASGLIVSIGEWVLRRAALLAAQWPQPVRLAVNLSPAQFAHRDLVALVEAVLGKARLPADRLELEITESLLLADDAQTLTALHGLRALGVRIAMDDFGTGYSSLSYLRSFPFDRIKIDRSFMSGLDERGDHLAIVKAVATLGASLGMAVTAEGVETAAQLEAARAQGCDEAQGFFISAPMAQEAAVAMLVRQAEAEQAPPLRLVR